MIKKLIKLSLKKLLIILSLFIIGQNVYSSNNIENKTNSEQIIFFNNENDKISYFLQEDVSGIDINDFKTSILILDKYFIKFINTIALKNFLDNNKKVRISMVGDNITHYAVLQSGAYASRKYKTVEPLTNSYGKKYLPAGTEFDFSNTYKRLKPTLDTCDLNLINIESNACGDNLDFTSFPMFNAPRNLIDNVHDVGFNVFLHANNHCLDRKIEGLMSALQYEKENFKDVTRVGAYLDMEEFNTPCIIEKNGIKIAIINYTYGFNGFHLPNDKKYLALSWESKADEIGIKMRVENAKKNADFVIVCPHWGTEYTHEPTAVQKKQAKLLAEWGADLILGSHPHVLQPDEWIDNTYVVYSVGNLLWTSVSTMFDNRAYAIGLMPVIDISRKKDGKVTIDKIEINPTITHEGRKEDVYVTLMKDYTKEEAGKNMFTFAYKAYSLKDLWDVFYTYYDSVEREVK